MNRLLILLPTLLLAGCLSTTVPVKMSFPQVPDELMRACPGLKDVDTNTDKLTDVLKIVSSNYGQYNDCKTQVDGWMQWYNTQKKIFEEVK